MAFMLNLNNLLSQKGLSRADLVKLTEIPKPTVYNWFTRNSIPPADYAYRIAKALNVTVENLVTGKISSDRIPPRLSGIVDDLNNLSDDQLAMFELQIHAVAESNRAAAESKSKQLG